MPLIRSALNPIITPAMVPPSRPDFEVVCAFNAGVARLGNEVILLLRVAERPRSTDPRFGVAPIFDVQTGQMILKTFARDNPAYDFSDTRMIFAPEGMYLTSLSHLRVARSLDGEHFTIDPAPALFPATEYETYGLEDPRITLIDGTYYIAYTAVSPRGIVVALASTRDFKTYERLGVMLPPDNKDVALFPEKINGRYYTLHRPCQSAIGRTEIWLAESPDLVSWGRHQSILRLQEAAWDEARIGAGAPPLRTPQGWLEIYHGVNHAGVYMLGLTLLAADNPARVLARGLQPLLVPEADYEINGFFGKVVFSCGALCEDGLLKIYYGAADAYMGYATIPLAEALDCLQV